jgi:NAD+ synthetase
MRVTLAQLNPVVGDLLANGRMIVTAARRAAADRADLLVTAELSVIGYPPRDLLRRGDVIEAGERAAATIAGAVADFAPELTLLLGHPRRCPGGMRGVRNAVTAWRGGRLVGTVDKRLLPGYDVFDEDRWFDPAPDAQPLLEVAGRRIGVVLCEDLWQSHDADDVASYAADPVGDVLAAGAEVLVAINASPFVAGKERRHGELLAATARRGPVPLVSVNQVGADDDLVFDGRSRVVDAAGDVCRRLPAFEAAVETVDLATLAADAPPPEPPAEAEIAAALRCGIRDYVAKTGHRTVVLGLSGGIDSAVVAALAVWALGPDAVHGLLMPSRHSSAGSITDAEDLADRLGMTTTRVPIGTAHDAVRETLAPVLGDGLDGLPDENVQARLRGLLLMGWSNARGGLLLATSNKSELAVGYSTLYGDMCGALAPIGDLLKGQVWGLARWMNAAHAELGFARPPIPVSTIDKPPSAELRPDQRDEDSLPPYVALDRVVDAWVGHDRSLADAAAAGAPELDAAAAEDWCRAIDRNEYKRFQGPVILKIAPRAFGPGRPMPVVMRWRPIDAASELDPGAGEPAATAAG